MGRTYPEIDDALRGFIERQHVFFVATAPSGDQGHVNCSPKGLDCLRVLGPHTVAYLDFVGSGAETIAHLRENGRIVLLFCAFDGTPKIVRLHGRGEVTEPGDDGFATLLARFLSRLRRDGDHSGVRKAPPRENRPPGLGLRSIIRVEVQRVSDSCGFGVPRMRFEEERSQLPVWAERKGADGLREYQVEKNATSIDGLPALGWVATRRGDSST